MEMDHRLQPLPDSVNGGVPGKQLFGDSLTGGYYDGQVAKAIDLARALNKMTRAGFAQALVLLE